MNNFVVAIDGPAGAGKSTVAKEASKRLSVVYVDTGAMYRTVALYAIEKGVEKDNNAIISLLDEIDIDIKYTDGAQSIFLNGRDVSGLIRTNEVSMGASAVAVIPEVRLKLVELQRNLAKNQSVIMDGRDIGTYVFPNADVKIFLTASPETRAERRYIELIEKGLDADRETILKDIKKRDKNDSEREFAPLRQAHDAVLLDTSDLSLEEAISAAIEIIDRGVKSV